MTILSKAILQIRCDPYQTINGSFHRTRTTIFTVHMETQKKEEWDAYIELAKVCIQLSDNESAEKYLIFVQEKNPTFKAAEIDSLLESIK